MLFRVGLVEGEEELEELPVEEISVGATVDDGAFVTVTTAGVMVAA